MAYVVPSNSLCQIIIRGRHENQDVMSVFHYRYTDSSPIVDGADALERIWTRWNAAGGMLELWCQAVTENLVAVETRLQWITPNRFAYITKTEVANSHGIVPGDAMPVNTAVCITKRCQNAGRQFVGTLHMPGVPVSSIINGAVTAGGLARYAAVAAQVKTQIVTFGTVIHLDPVLFHKSSPDISPIIVNTSVQPFARVERRRTVGLGS